MCFVKKLLDGKEKIAVVGLGYVGLPLALAFAEKFQVIGFDSNKQRIREYAAGIDSKQEVSQQEWEGKKIIFTASEEKIKEARFIIIAVPTPVYEDNTPDLSILLSACKTVGRHMKKGSMIVLESTVYPGVTEEICGPVLEKESGLRYGEDFKVGYSPERVNPGDAVHKIQNMVKLVSGMDAQALEIISSVYCAIIKAGVYKTGSIRVAEAAKLVENAQRDINIAFMNELALIFDRLAIPTQEVLEAMRTKWNALDFSPGLVGGHCISVDPYYFIYQAQKAGYHSRIIQAGRRINDSMGNFIADTAVKKLTQTGIVVKKARIFIFGITFKENCQDIRNSKSMDIFRRLKEYGIDPQIVDPVADEREAKEVYGVTLCPMELVTDADCIIAAVAHDVFCQFSRKQLDSFFSVQERKVLLDVKSIYYNMGLQQDGYQYWSL